LRPGRTYDYWHDRRHPLSYYFAHFDLLDPDGAVLGPDQVDLPSEEIHVPDHQLANSLLDYLVRCVRLRQSPGVLGEAAELFQFLLRQMERATHTRNPQSPRIAPDQERAVSQALRYLDLHLLEPIGVAELAKRVGYSRGHFTELFRLVTGTSPGEYLITARIAWAKQVLVQTTTPVSTIARQAGYREQPYFSRQFRERTGLSPTAFRAAHRGQNARRATTKADPS
jgi:transcriptional regulator GlxA family with amidase domain